MQSGWRTGDKKKAQKKEERKSRFEYLLTSLINLLNIYVLCILCLPLEMACGCAYVHFSKLLVLKNTNLYVGYVSQKKEKYSNTYYSTLPDELSLTRP